MIIRLLEYFLRIWMLMALVASVRTTDAARAEIGAIAAGALWCAANLFREARSGEPKP